MFARLNTFLSARYGPYLTSYDVVKFIALVLMVADHCGAFLFPDNHWLRMVGRMSAPIWFVLIGYADTRRLPVMFLWGTLLLLVTGLVTAGPVFPFNILVTIAIIRSTIDRYAPQALESKASLFRFFVTLAVLAFPLNMLFDYGSMALLIALYGYMLAHPHQGRNSPLVTKAFGGLLVVFYTAYESFVFQFSLFETGFVFAGVIAVFLMMTCFRPHQFVAQDALIPHILKVPMQLAGRYSMEFYIIHLVLFKFIAAYLHIGDFAWFHPVLFPWDHETFL